ncbi:LppU family putative lipoprotein [Nocardia callitridis]|uniref:LppU family putative lipoprotein n=1 Tax=Nocardia callitridis TaxID=648753 RepID=UPI0031E8EDB5
MAGFIGIAALAAVIVAGLAITMSDSETTDNQAKVTDTTTTTPETTDSDDSNGAPTTSVITLSTTPELPPPPPPETSAIQGGVNKDATAVQMNVGDCVSLAGGGATIDKTTCGSSSSTYKVVDKAPADSQCPSDVDHTFDGTLRGADHAALCLDIDWVIGSCMELTPGNPQRVDCGTQGISNGVRIVEIRRDTTNIYDCGTANDRGIVYQQRRFVVCAAQL